MSNPEPVEGKCNYHPTQDDGYCAQAAGMGVPEDSEDEDKAEQETLESETVKA